MKEEIINNYDPRIKCILISKDYRVCDGNHRYMILLEHYGGEHIIIVKKGKFSRRAYAIFVIFFTSIITIVALPFYLLVRALRLITKFKIN